MNMIPVPEQLLKDIQEYLWNCSDLSDDSGIYYELTEILENNSTSDETFKVSYYDLARFHNVYQEWLWENYHGPMLRDILKSGIIKG
jgi:hypothetical protein